MEVHCDEGVAIHIGPEPCVAVREDGSEASAGECIGQPLSRVSNTSRGADAVRRAEGNTVWHAIASATTLRRGQRPWHVQTLLVREPGDPTSDHRQVAEMVRIGKARNRSR